MDIVLRVTVIYLFILAGMRVLGKREFGSLTPFELVTLFLIPEMVSGTLLGGDHSLTGGLIGIATLFGLVFLLTILTHLSGRADDWVEGKPAVLVEHGKMLEDVMNVERVNPGDIFVAMHRAGVEDLDSVKWAILESDGKISIIQKEKDSGRQPKKDIAG